MAPQPCAHCGFNFMKSHPRDPNNLCNNCAVREELRNPTKKADTVQTIEIKLQVPFETHKEIEEICQNEGLSFSQYFLNLHEEAGEYIDQSVEPAEEPLKKAKAAKK